eukprot:Skav226961  [mRNA]  locus=scaffold51:180424:190206:- [translate_table: standard]
MAPKPPVKLDLSYNARDGDSSTLDWSVVPEGVLPYEELDFSYNGITSSELDRVLEICCRCPKLRVLKLFKNSIDDAGADGIAHLCQTSPGIEEIHLSHNMFTADGATAIIIAAEGSRNHDTGRKTTACADALMQRHALREPARRDVWCICRTSVCSDCRMWILNQTCHRWPRVVNHLQRGRCCASSAMTWIVRRAASPEARSKHEGGR